MQLTFLGATHEVTGSCYYLEGGGSKFLVDCGMEQGPNFFENKEIPVPPSDLDFVLLTHAHIDHSGNLPKLYGKDFGGRYNALRERQISVILCFGTVPISRCLRQSGGTGRENGQERKCMCLLIRWRMRSDF